MENLHFIHLSWTGRIVRAGYFHASLTESASILDYIAHTQDDVSPFTNAYQCIGMQMDGQTCR